MPVALRRGGELVMPLLVAACVAAKVELNTTAATAAIRMLKMRIAFPPLCPGRSTIRLTTNVEHHWQFLLSSVRNLNQIDRRTNVIKNETPDQPILVRTVE